MSRRAPGEGSLYFDTHRGRWVAAATVTPDPMTGRQRRVKVVGRDGEGKRSVSQRFKDRLVELEASSPAAPVTVAELISQWRARTAPKRKSVTTLAMTDSLIRNHIIPVLGSVRVADLTAEHVESFLDARASGLSKSTLIKLRTILAQAFDYGVRRRHVNWNPARVAELPVDVGSPREGRSLTVGEARSLFNVVSDHRLGCWVVLATTLGLRPGECSALTWEAVDVKAGTLTVYASLSWPSGVPVVKETKSKRTRTLDLPAVAVEALARHRKVQAGERLAMGDRWPRRWASLLFVSEEGTPVDPSNLRRLVARWRFEAGIDGDLRPYDLRHTATSLISEGGLSAERLADLLGHKDTRMVFGHYRHPVTASVSTAVEYWDRGELNGELTRPVIGPAEIPGETGENVT